ncbi:rhodanese-like domain-containing protein [Kiritimatiellota bacterium B12222]|nr:rhodanese-like domain-containing protein [Kiritimatiellota bacterium B12222]
MDIPQITPEDLPDNHHYLILDVREVHEWDFVNIPGSVHLPLGQLPLRHQELPQDRAILTLCHHGMRSQQAARFLKQAGFKEVCNLSGGIDRWSVKKTPQLPRY